MYLHLKAMLLDANRGSFTLQKGCFWLLKATLLPFKSIAIIRSFCHIREAKTANGLIINT